MTCTNCGHKVKINGNVEFCTSCGAKLDVYQLAASKRVKKQLCIIIGVVCSVVLMYCVYYFFIPTPTQLRQKEYVILNDEPAMASNDIITGSNDLSIDMSTLATGSSNPIATLSAIYPFRFETSFIEEENIVSFDILGDGSHDLWVYQTFTSYGIDYVIELRNADYRYSDVVMINQYFPTNLYLSDYEKMVSDLGDSVFYDVDDYGGTDMMYIYYNAYTIEIASYTHYNEIRIYPEY